MANEYEKYMKIKGCFDDFMTAIDPYIKEKAKLRRLETAVRVEILGENKALKKPMLVVRELEGELQKYDNLLDLLIDMERKRLINLINYTLDY